MNAPLHGALSAEVPECRRHAAKPLERSAKLVIVVKTMHTLRAKARPAVTKFKGSTITVDRPISGDLEESFPSKGRRLNKKQPVEPKRRLMKKTTYRTQHTSGYAPRDY